MTTRRITIGLLEAARAEFNAAILPHLGPGQRQQGAMFRRALEVLHADATASKVPEAALREAGFGNAVDQAGALRAYATAKLEMDSPHFLTAIDAAGKGAD